MCWLLGMRPLLQNLLDLGLTMSHNISSRQLQRHLLTIADVATNSPSPIPRAVARQTVWCAMDMRLGWKIRKTDGRS